MIKLTISLYILILCFGAFCALCTFIYDVIKWHNLEKKENIINSADLYYGKGGVIRGRGNNGTTDNDNNDGTTTDNNNDIHNDNGRSDGNIQFEW